MYERNEIQLQMIEQARHEHHFPESEPEIRLAASRASGGYSDAYTIEVASRYAYAIFYKQGGIYRDDSGVIREVATGPMSMAVVPSRFAVTTAELLADMYKDRDERVKARTDRTTPSQVAKDESLADGLKAMFKRLDDLFLKGDVTPVVRASVPPSPPAMVEEAWPDADEEIPF